MRYSLFPVRSHALTGTAADEAPVLGIGLMSGTSADGIDAAAVELWREAGTLRVRQRAFRSQPYPAAIREALFRCFADQATTRVLCELNAAIGECFADAAEAVLREVPASAPSLAFLASHGQTVWHEPPDGGRLGNTLQLGEAARMAVRLNVPVVSDFRQQDLALGGHGAPLVPYVDHLLFADATESRVLQNIGGIANAAYLPAGAAPEAVVAFDTGPGNVWMDAATELHTQGAQSYDLGGRLAASAPVDGALLAELLREPYFTQQPPKSTGRERFTTERVRALWDQGHQGAELVSTLTQLTVESIAESYRRWLGPVDRVVVAGGGARNGELMRRLARAVAPATVCTLDHFGFDGDAKEAVAFAIMGYETLYGRPSNLPSATGARRPVVQGKICLG